MTPEILESISSVGVPIFISIIFVYLSLNNNNKYLEALQGSSEYKDILNSLNDTNENISKTLDLMQKQLEMLEKLSTTMITAQNEIQRNTNINNHKIEKVYLEVKILEQFVLDYIKLEMENDTRFNKWKRETIEEVKEESESELENINNGKYW